jgi:ubiquinone/menaquinone biosynthesis C-methylase UbiE
MSQKELWKNWDEEKHYGDLFYKRATGQSPEMQSSGAASRVIKEFYTGKETLLDVGCGAGHYLKSLRNIVAEDIKYTGVDPTAYYIELAQKAYNGSADFKVGSIFDIPFEDNSFDIVMCNNVVMHLPPENIKKAFDELMRVARKKIVVRAMFGIRNYIVREILTGNDLEPGSLDKIVYEDFDLTNSKFRYFNSYTQDFYEQMIQKDNKVSIEIRPDRDWKQFDNIPDAKIETATKTLADYQVSGNIILDWRFILIDK